MENNDANRSGWQTAASLARTGKAAANIARAAASGGAYGAAAAAVKESAPNLLKAVLYMLIAVVVTTMVVFTAIPSIFFGFNSSQTESITHMTNQAVTIGGVCLSMKGFENTVVDAIVTGIVSEYEREAADDDDADGDSDEDEEEEEEKPIFDKIEVISQFDEDSLLWLTAINSTAHAQNLDDMSAEALRELCNARLSHSFSLINGTQTTLRITIGKLDPDDWMEKLGFDEEAKTWATALYETLVESDALTKYAAYFDANAPDYSGDGTYTGGVEHGTSYGNDIDTSHFIDPTTKNAHDLAAYAVQAWENNWGYVWGTFGNVLTPSLLEYKVKQYPDGVGQYAGFIREHYLNRRTADCIGLVKSYGWFNAATGGIDYGSNGVPDYSANQMYRDAVNKGADHGTIANMPEIPGLVLWKEGHTGIYIGGGYAVEAMSTSKGVGKTQVAGRGWQAWYKLPYYDYG